MDTGSINPVALSLAASLSGTKPAEQRAEQHELIKAVRALNGVEAFGQHQELQFTIDRDSKRPVLKIVDRKTGEVVAQVPPEHVLRLAKQVEKR